MPELAEVALFAKQLSRVSRGRKLNKVLFPNWHDGGSSFVSPELKKKILKLRGQEICFTSFGKRLQIRSGDTVALEIRLGMTGQFHLTKLENHWRRHYFLQLQVGDLWIHYADPRRFSRLLVPFRSSFSLGGVNRAGKFVTNRRFNVPSGFLKSPRIAWLLVHGEKTGVGNYMANEALGRLNLDPFISCKNENEARMLLLKCQEVARESFRYGGNSFGSKFFSIDGKEGRYSQKCQYYQNPAVPRIMYRGRPIFTWFKE